MFLLLLFVVFSRRTLLVWFRKGVAVLLELFKKERRKKRKTNMEKL